jgi:uncharacterized protein with NAD-binding domain and iron-sulfur cluster
MTAAAPGKKKIAILGGGMGSLAAAFELTRPPGWQDRYEITVYQMGWRLGGKGASGRNHDKADRIEEHGLHIWMGMYENAFHIMQECYAELARPAGSPLATWTDAFKKHSLTTMMEQVDGQWIPWSFNVPTNDGVPGQGGVCLSPFNMVRRLIQWMEQSFEQGLQPDSSDTGSLLTHLARARKIAEGLGDLVHLHPPADHQALVRNLDLFRAGLRAGAPAPMGLGNKLRRLRILLELGATVARGILMDRVSTSFDPLDECDFNEWLTRHGASQELLNSAVAQAAYVIMFAYEKGDLARPRLAAGVALRFVLRTLFCYQGAFIYKMQAGMGDVVFAPLYLVLKKRGVQFKFFHRVENLGLSADKRSVATIRMARQVTLRSGEYQPLVRIKGLDCWPSTPLFEQIDPVEAAQIRELLQRDIEPLESAWSPWKPAATITLQASVDFDCVVLGISLSALRYIGKELIDSNGQWRDMVNNVQTVQTEASQLWLDRDADDLGWRHMPERAMVGCYRDTWSDMTQVLPWENWPRDQVRSIAYFCNPLPDEPDIPDPSYDPAFQIRQKQRVKDLTLNDLKTGLTRPFWPEAQDPNNPNQLNWDRLVDPTAAQGEKRLDSQFWRANVDPTERYVLSLPKSTRYRLKAGESGFANLYLAGDWLNTGINAGCIEAAVMGGRQASRALSGSPQTVFGEQDFCPSALDSARTGLTSLFGFLPFVKRIFSPSPRAPATARASRPIYVDRGGEQVLSQPAALRDVSLYSFLLKADINKLSALCDKYLNNPSASQVRYVPLIPYVALVACSIGHMQSAILPYSQMGWSSERDVSFWVPLLGLKRLGSVWLPDRLVWFLPYVIVDHPWACAIGREIYGFPKAMGAIQFPMSPSQFNALTVNTLVLDPFDPTTQTESRPLVQIERVGDGTTWIESWGNDMAAAFADFARTLFGGRDSFVHPGLAQEIHRHLLLTEPTLVFLKQFRDVADGQLACYQAIVEAPSRLVGLRQAGALAGEYRVTLDQYASHPIRDELGLAEQSALRGWYVDFDFDLEVGKEVWKA